MTKPVRVRFAPSPTGEVHIGSIWLAQFDWLFAKQQGGKFIIRIEDTDRQRLVPGSIEKIYEALEWYGLTPDEGPNHGGEYGPYIQSERLELYQKHAQQLIEQGSAYYCFCTAERLATMRTAQEAAKQPPRYDKLCAALGPAESKARVAKGEPAVIRLNVPVTGAITLDDIIRGQITFRLDQVDDAVLLKSDGWPTYHLAVVVDDHLMEISHVLRAEEWLSSTPKHLLLYRAFGWTPPIFAHLPQILGANKKKLSKRDNAAGALQFRDQGYLVEAMQNFLALMGWHPKGDKEVLPREQILKEFTLENINPSGAIFDQTKLNWMNGYYIRQLPLEELYQRALPFWDRPAQSVDWEQQALTLIKDRMEKLSDITDLTSFLFPATWNTALASVDQQIFIPKKGSLREVHVELRWVSDLLTSQTEWTASALRPLVLERIKQGDKSTMAVLWPLRVVLSLRSASPDVFDLLGLLGQRESLRRILAVLERLG